MNEEKKEEIKDETKDPSKKGDAASDAKENMLWGIIAYLGILCLIPLLAKKDSQFAQFHAKQGLVMAIGGFFAWIPFFGWMLGLLLFVLWIMAIISVVNGEMKPLPVVGELAAKINI
ncbi:MAG: hypothetical protein HGB08_04400 [Candidatus Moranbacteria bacterium]|nr:hypothetical protein [Candidatus Moranbacteria bacterium]